MLSLLLLLSALFAPALALRLADQPPRPNVAAERSAYERRVSEAAALSAPRPHSSGQVHFDLLAKLLADDRRSSAACDCPAKRDSQESKHRVCTQAHPLVGQLAPDFSLLDHQGRAWRLGELAAAGPVVLVFYLGYGCDACVHNLFELDADLAGFRALGAQVVAISPDSSEVTRNRFARYGAFGFPVLSDPDDRIAFTYGAEAPATEGEAAPRMHATFLVGRDGRVVWAYLGSTPFRNNQAILLELRRADKRASPNEAAISNVESTEPEELPGPLVP